LRRFLRRAGLGLLALGVLALPGLDTAFAAPTTLPIQRIYRDPVEPFPGGGAVPAYRLRAGQPGTEVQAGDLAFDAATAVGAGVERVLDEVGADPQAAYLWVRNNVEF